MSEDTLQFIITLLLGLIIAIILLLIGVHSIWTGKLLGLKSFNLPDLLIYLIGFSLSFIGISMVYSIVTAIVFDRNEVIEKFIIPLIGIVPAVILLLLGIDIILTRKFSGLGTVNFPAPGAVFIGFCFVMLGLAILYSITKELIKPSDEKCNDKKVLKG